MPELQDKKMGIEMMLQQLLIYFFESAGNNVVVWIIQGLMCSNFPVKNK